MYIELSLGMSHSAWVYENDDGNQVIRVVETKEGVITGVKHSETNISWLSHVEILEKFGPEFKVIEVITICPYCGDGPKVKEFGGCCGESSAHFTEVYQDQNGETYELDEVETYKPILDWFRYEIFNRWVWHSRKQLYKRKIKNAITKFYDGEYWDIKSHSVKKSFIRQLRESTGFQWTKLDCLILKTMHDFPLYYTKPQDIKYKLPTSYFIND